MDEDVDGRMKRGKEGREIQKAGYKKDKEEKNAIKKYE